MTGREGSDRKTGTMLLFLEAGTIKACLGDRETELNAFVSAKTFQGLLEACDKGLKTGALDWREKKVYRR